MRITALHVIPSFAGGGAERQLVRLAAGLSEAGVDVHIAYLHPGPNFDAAMQSGATLHQLNVSSNHDPRALFRLRALIKKIRPTVIQTWLLHADVFGGIAARMSGIPWLLSERSSAAMYSNGLKFKLRRRLGLFADAIVANSEGGLAYWRAASFRRPCYLIRNIVQPPIVNLTEPAIVAKVPTLLAIGRLSEEKNYPLLLEALEILFKRLPEVQATILGEGPEHLRLLSRVASSTTLSGRVNFLGHVEDVPRRLAEASVFVSLSRFEGTPNTVVEAIVHGCPLVISDIPAHRELLTPDEACFVEFNSPNAIAEVLYKQLIEYQEARARAQRAKHRLGDWSMERIAEQYIAVYNDSEKRSKSCE